MLVEKAERPETYIGTPRDETLYEHFGDMFGEIKIGQGDSRPNLSIQNYALNRWRATELGANGLLNIEDNKKAAKAVLAAAASLKRTKILNTQPEVATGNLAEPQTNTTITNKGQKCSNIECPLSSRYSKAVSKLWFKCAKNCFSCKGSFKFCPDDNCKKIFDNHTERAAKLFIDADNRQS